MHKNAPSSLAPLCRLAAWLVMSAGIAVVIAAFASGDTDTRFIIISLGAAATSIGLALVLAGMAAVLSRNSNSEVSDADVLATRLQNGVAELTRRVEILTDRVAQSPRPAAPSVVAPAPTANGTSLDDIKHLLEEIRDLSLLPDSERSIRVDRMKESRKLKLVRIATELLDKRQWASAVKQLDEIESEFPHEPQVATLRRQLQNERADVEAGTVMRTIETIDEYLEDGNHDTAYSIAQKLVDDFPYNTSARATLDRVNRQRDLFREATASRLFDDIRHDVDQRQWRTALSKSQQLLEQFPDYRRADKVRHQLQLIRDNAEIEERQELEVRIQELIRNHQFVEAIDLGEQVIRDYPMSPQAESLELLLPRVRAMLLDSEAESAA